jgi:hypothetical protein
LNAPANLRSHLTPQLTPRGHLLALPQDDTPLLDDAVRERLEQAFATGAGAGLLHLGTTEIGRILPPAWAWWRDLAARDVMALCATPEAWRAAPIARTVTAKRSSARPKIKSR